MVLSIGALLVLPAFEELAQNGVRHEAVLTGLLVRATPFGFSVAAPQRKAVTAVSSGSRGSHGLLWRLLRNSRKTECGAKQFLAGLAVRAAPFALRHARQ